MTLLKDSFKNMSILRGLTVNGSKVNRDLDDSQDLDFFSVSANELKELCCQTSISDEELEDILSSGQDVDLGKSIRQSMEPARAAAKRLFAA